MFTFGERNNLFMLSRRQPLFWGDFKHYHLPWPWAYTQNIYTATIEGPELWQQGPQEQGGGTAADVTRQQCQSNVPLAPPSTSIFREWSRSRNRKQDVTQEKPLGLVVTLWVLLYSSYVTKQHGRCGCFLYFLFFEEKEGQVRVNEFNVRQESRRC